jgi:hypothetical protein
MLSALIIFCTPDLLQCNAVANRQIFKTEKECHAGIAEGFAYFEEQGFIVADWKCVKVMDSEEASK